MKKLFYVVLLVGLCSSCLAFFSSCDQFFEPTALSAEKIYESVSPSVVSVFAVSSEGTNAGTAFFYGNGSTIVTNYHVIEGCHSAYMMLPNGERYDVVSILGYDKNEDIAILKVDYENGIPATVRTTEVKTGEVVYAIGNSLGFLEGSLSEGIVSTAKREVSGYTYIQTTVAVTHGNSGGPLIDAYGNVIGVVSAGFGDGELELNLAIPISRVSTINTESPKKLSEMIKVEFISNRKVWHQDDKNGYVLIFTLSDANQRPVAAEGAVAAYIVNNGGERVYSGIIDFDVDDFQYIYSADYTSKMYVAVVIIKDADIAAGNWSTGKLTFSIVGQGFFVDECTLMVYGLP